MRMMHSNILAKDGIVITVATTTSRDNNMILFLFYLGHKNSSVGSFCANKSY